MADKQDGATAPKKQTVTFEEPADVKEDGGATEGGGGDEAARTHSGLVRRLTLKVEPRVVQTRAQSERTRLEVAHQRHHAFETVNAWMAAQGATVTSFSFLTYMFRPGKDRRRHMEVHVSTPARESGDAGGVQASSSDKGHLERRGSRVALQRRMSRIPKHRRQEMIKNIEQRSRDDMDNQKVHRKQNSMEIRATSLEGRLASLHLSSVEMIGDGNCQFRAMAHQIYRDQERYEEVRRRAVAHMQEHADFFGIFFESHREFRSYINGMGRNRTWGDELTLRAIVESYGCNAHVITSTPENWYLVYKPEQQAVDDVANGKDVFLTYVSPIHYNAIISA